MAHILLVEDDKSIVTNLSEFLQKEGYSITAVDGHTHSFCVRFAFHLPRIFTYAFFALYLMIRISTLITSFILPVLTFSS